MDYDVVVVGAGIGGIGCAALLSHAGLKTLVLERNPFLGGKCSSFEKKGCIIDTFVHSIPTCEGGPLGEILRRTSMPEAVKFWHPDAEHNEKMIINGKAYAYPDPRQASPEEMQNTFKALDLPDQDHRAMLRLYEDIYRMTEDGTHDLDHVAYDDFLLKYSSHETFVSIHGVFCLLMGGLMPFEASAGEVIRMTRSWHLRGRGGYPLGGCQAIPNGYAGIVRHYGGEVRTGAPADGILVDRGAAAGVRLGNGQEIRARAVVSNAGLKETVNMVPQEALPSEYRDYVQGLSCGMIGSGAIENPILSVHVLLSEKVTEDTIALAIPLAGGSLFDLGPNTADKFIPLDRFSTYLTVPSNMDPALTPPGQQLINFNAVIPPGGMDTREVADVYLNTLDLLYPGLRQKMIWSDAVRGAAIKEYSGRLQSDIVGLGQTVGQVGRDRPAIESPLAGLFYVGADVGRDNIGTELAAESALRAVDIVKDYLR